MRTYRILSIDGGGIKGIMPIMWLIELEKQVGPLKDHFDLMAGTSVGSVITCGLAMGLSAKEILYLFEKDIRKAFPPLWKRWRHKLCNPLGSIYPASGINGLLEDVFGDMKYGDLESHLMSISYDLTNGTPAIFCNHGNPNLLIKDVCRASSAAPVFFPPHTFDNKTYIDGAIVANNPAAFCLPIYLKERVSKESRPFIVSMGTGSPDYNHSSKELENWSQLDWLSNILRIVFDGTSDAHDHILATNHKIEHYYRFQTPLILPSGAIDDISYSNIESLKREARIYLNGDVGENMLNRIVEELSQ
ncbi:MAG: patatin-like phospholipase family protein [Candidatus Thorarchaeota archaeon]|jgi:patatin-like phospholipase/acyl hydrolase